MSELFDLSGDFWGIGMGIEVLMFKIIFFGLRFWVGWFVLGMRIWYLVRGSSVWGGGFVGGVYGCFFF